MNPILLIQYFSPDVSATREPPLGPFTKRGVIIDNTGCDPETWNNHGSIAGFNGQWLDDLTRSRS